MITNPQQITGIVKQNSSKSKNVIPMTVGFSIGSFLVTLCFFISALLLWDRRNQYNRSLSTPSGQENHNGPRIAIDSWPGNVKLSEHSVDCSSESSDNDLQGQGSVGSADSSAETVKTSGKSRGNFREDNVNLNAGILKKVSAIQQSKTTSVTSANQRERCSQLSDDSSSCSYSSTDEPGHWGFDAMETIEEGGESMSASTSSNESMDCNPFNIVHQHVLESHCKGFDSNVAKKDLLSPICNHSTRRSKMRPPLLLRNQDRAII